MDHGKSETSGQSFYYCCIHRAFHCIRHLRIPHRQPACGECAVLFYIRPGPAIHVPENDMLAQPVLPSRTQRNNNNQPENSTSTNTSCRARPVLPDPDVIMGNTDEAERARAGDLRDMSSRRVQVRIRCAGNNVLQHIPPNLGEFFVTDFTTSQHTSTGRRAGRRRSTTGGGDVILMAYPDNLHKGWPALQPTAAEGRDLATYLAPLELAEVGRCDHLLQRFRHWSCWAQGFQGLELEFRWGLTFLFDFCNVMIVEEMKLPGELLWDSPLFWMCRRHLHDLVCIVVDLGEKFGLADVPVPEVDWEVA